MERNFLTKFLNKISEFPGWAKEIIYNHLSCEVEENSPLVVFASYKPILTYKGRCELDFRKSGFDRNVYNLLQASDNDFSISEISLNTFLSIEEVARYFLFCVDEGYFELPDNSQILNIAGFLTGKYRTGEYFMNAGNISEIQLANVINQKFSENSGRKFGQYLIENGYITKTQLDVMLNVKQESQKRFILDYHEVPSVKRECSNIENTQYQQQIDELQAENKQLKSKLNQLLTIVHDSQD